LSLNCVHHSSVEQFKNATWHGRIITKNEPRFFCIIFKNTVDKYKISHIPNVSIKTKNNEERKYKTWLLFFFFRNILLFFRYKKTYYIYIKCKSIKCVQKKKKTPLNELIKCKLKGFFHLFYRIEQYLSDSSGNILSYFLCSILQHIYYINLCKYII